MLPTYKATLHGDRLEWDDDVPEPVRGTSAVSVFVTILGDSGSAITDRGRHMADALERLARRGGLSAIGDALDWQRDEREDRPLPGRLR